MVWGVKKPYFRNIHFMDAWLNCEKWSVELQFLTVEKPTANGEPTVGSTVGRPGNFWFPWPSSCGFPFGWPSKIRGGFYPPNHLFVHRVFHQINHPFWGTHFIFGNIHFSFSLTLLFDTLCNWICCSPLRFSYVSSWGVIHQKTTGPCEP